MHCYLLFTAELSSTPRLAAWNKHGTGGTYRLIPFLQRRKCKCTRGCSARNPLLPACLCKECNHAALHHGPPLVRVRAPAAVEHAARFEQAHPAHLLAFGGYPWGLAQSAPLPCAPAVGNSSLYFSAPETLAPHLGVSN
jgi:hypothetical protein